VPSTLHIVPFCSLGGAFYKGADACVLVFDKSNPEVRQRAVSSPSTHAFTMAPCPCSCFHHREAFIVVLIVLLRARARMAHRYLLCARLASQSFSRLSMWREEFLLHSCLPSADDVPFIVLGNKCDLVDNIRVSTEEAEAWCRANRITVRLFLPLTPCGGINAAVPLCWLCVTCDVPRLTSLEVTRTCTRTCTRTRALARALTGSS
jgi:GTPase SAR1 family protein